MKKSIKNLRNIFIGIGLVLVLGFIVYFGVGQKVIEFRPYSDTTRIPLESGTFNLGDYEGNYETTILGEISCSGYSGAYYCYAGGTNPIDRVSSFGNSLNGGDKLILTSSASSEDDAFENYIKADIILPKGTLDVLYEYSSNFESESSDRRGLVTITIEDEKFNIMANAQTSSDYEFDSYVINLDSEQEINIKILTSTYSSGSSSSFGKVILSFIPDIEEEITPDDPIVITPEENFDNDFNYANLLFLLIPFAFLLVFFIILKKKSKRGRK